MPTANEAAGRPHAPQGQEDNAMDPARPGPASSDRQPTDGTSRSVADAPAWFMAQVIERTTQPFALVEFSGRIARVNRAFAKLLGYTTDELLRLTLRDITPVRWVEETAEPLARLRATGKTERYEKEYVRKDGSLVPVDVVVDVYRDEQERPIGYFAFVTDVSERKCGEAALKESEERFRSLYDEAPVGYHEIDLEGTILNVNRTECELIGYTREEMVGRPIFDFVSPAAREEAQRAVREKIAGLRPLEPFEREYVTRDGRALVLAIEDRFKLDDQSQIVGIRTTIQNVTAKKQAEGALVASERRARALFEGIEDAVFVHDLEGRILDANPAACRRLGYTREELLRLTTRDIDEPDFAQGFPDRLQEQMRLGHLSFEGRHRTKDGRAVPVDINTSIIQLEEKRAVLAVMRDISERKALEKTRRELDEANLRNAQEVEAKNRELTRSEARYRQLTEGCLDAVVVANSEGNITLFNPAAERTFGYQANEVLGQPLTTLMPPTYRPLHDAGFARFIATRESHIVGRTVELYGRRKNGEEFPLELSLNAVDIFGQVQFIGSIRDQTERQRMRAMLVQTEKLASIGLLSAGVAHEINNPLSYIANNLAVLERDLKCVIAMMVAYESANDRLAAVAPDVVEQVKALGEDLDWPYVRDNLGRMLARTRDGVQRVANIVNNLRGLARTSPPKKEVVSVPDLLASAVEMVQGRMRQSKIELEIETDHPPKLPCVPSQLSQVILNLLVNAVQAVEMNHPNEGGKVRVSIHPSGHDLIIEIADNGPGIEPDQMTRLFDPFFTTKPVGEGTGLGLAISHGIVSGHGGRIDVESRPGAGACFRVLLPIGESG
ncbi:MAG TPA: PAS domain S-box protein [Isosphaeraceae bacterium]|nr:PAS domain S-box protein [Isosphaeraceae bacterium]